MAPAAAPAAAPLPASPPMAPAAAPDGRSPRRTPDALAGRAAGRRRRRRARLLGRPPLALRHVLLLLLRALPLRRVHGLGDNVARQGGHQGQRHEAFRKSLRHRSPLFSPDRPAPRRPLIAAPASRRRAPCTGVPRRPARPAACALRSIACQLGTRLGHHGILRKPDARPALDLGLIGPCLRSTTSVVI